MQTLRKKSLYTLSSTSEVVPLSSSKALDFAAHVFNKEKLKQFLSEKSFKQMLQSIEKGIPINLVLADQIAAVMKAWAISNGATHYTHWFQPITGATAEKHDSFFNVDDRGMQIEKFEGEQLVQQLPDASSFPSGSVRNTFEASGFTTWDPTSPVFIYEGTLCIPSLFISYTGEALDFKTPLIKSLQKLDKAASDVCHYFDKTVSKVNATLGWEQEFFLIDRSLAASRPDVMLTGRTLLGHSPSKNQDLNNHYFGSIPDRVGRYLKELENESNVLGIPVKTYHNEVAPSQYEIAPVFEEANLAVDHNALLMDLMNKIAHRHNFVVLFHEKPFDKINGS